MSLEAGTEAMLADAYEDAYWAAIARGVSADIAHREGIASVSIFLIALTGFEDAGQRIGIEALSTGWHH
jgi:hypothetical protein